MPPGGCNFQRAPGTGLAFDVGHIRVMRGLHLGSGRHTRPPCTGFSDRGIRVGRQKILHHIQQMARLKDLGIRHQGGFFRTLRRQDQPRLHATGMQSQTHGQGTAHRAQFPRQRQLPRKFMPGQSSRINLPAGSQNAQGNRQIEAARIFGQISRSQVDRDALVVWKLQPGVLDGGAHPLARLLHLDIGQPHQREAWQAIGQMDLNGDRRCIQAEQGTALHQRQTHAGSSPKRCTPSAAPRH